jgi:hypothetical protein
LYDRGKKQQSTTPNAILFSGALHRGFCTGPSQSANCDKKYCQPLGNSFLVIASFSTVTLLLDFVVQVCEGATQRFTFLRRWHHCTTQLWDSHNFHTVCPSSDPVYVSFVMFGLTIDTSSIWRYPSDIHLRIPHFMWSSLTHKQFYVASSVSSSVSKFRIPSLHGKSQHHMFVLVLRSFCDHSAIDLHAFNALSVQRKSN